MAKNIKGITVEIGGNTTKLGQALESSEKKSRSLQTELREIQKQLKFDPTNVELLSQKQTVLTQDIKETSDKLNILKESEKQVIAQFEKGEVAEEQVRALQREIIKTEGVLGSMKTELSNTEKALKDLADGTDNANKHTKEYKESVEKAKKEVKDFGDKAKESFDKVKTGVGVLAGATVAGVGYAVTLSSEFDKAFNTLITRTGASADEMDALNTSMENVYKNNFGENMEDVAVSMATVKNNTKLTGEALESMTQNALLLRDTFDFEVNESTRSAKMLMDQFGLSGDEAFNLIAQGAQNGLDKNGDLLDTINEYSVHFKQLGIDAPTMFNMLVNGADSGTFSVDKLGDAVKEFGIRVKDGSKATAEGFATIGLNADEMATKFGKGGESAKQALNETVTALFNLKDPIAQNQAGVALFGTMWEDLGVEGVKALMQMDGKISESNDALAQINEHKYDDIGSALQGLGRTLQTDVVEPLGEELKPVVEDAIEYVKANGPQIKEILSNVVKKIGEFVGWVVDNGPTIISVLGGIGAAFVTWKVASLINGVVKAIKAFKLANEGATIAQWAMNVAMNANPIGLIITAVVGLVTAFILLWKNCEGFRNFFIGLWDGIKTAMIAVGQWFAGIPEWVNNNIIQPVVNFFKGIWDGIVGIFQSIIEWVKTNWVSIVLFIINPFAGIFKYLWDNCEVFRNFLTGVGQWIYNNVIAPVANFFKGLWESIVSAYHTVIDPWIEIFRRLSVIVDTEIIQPIKQFFIDLWEKIKSGATALWEGIKAVFVTVATWFDTTVIQPVATFFVNLWTGVKNGATTLWEGVKSVFNAFSTWFNDTVITPVKNVFTGLWDGLKNGASKAWSGIKSVFSTVATFFKDIFTDAWTKVKNVFSVGGKIFDGIKDGIVSGFTTVVNAIIRGINKVVKVPFDGINWALDKIRSVDILGVKPFDWIHTISVPKIPELYRGGVLKKGQVGLLEGSGAEAVVPLEKNTGWLDKIGQRLNDYSNNRTPQISETLLDRLDRIYDRIEKLAHNHNIVLDSGALVGGTIDEIDAGLASLQLLKERGV